MSIDTDAASEQAAAWSRTGLEIAELQGRVDEILGGLAIGTTDRPVTRGLQAAAEHLWALTTFVNRVIEGVLLGDRFDVGALAAESGVGAAVHYTPWGGDRDWTGSRPVGAYEIPAGSHGEQGVALFAQALAHVSTTAMMRGDEFAIGRFGPNQYTIVLGGVTDLSSPDYGWSEANRTTRDADHSAFPEFFEEALGLDFGLSRYADAVAAAIEHEVPPGATVLLVGHSAGGQAAMELASDHEFTARYDVSHVLAFGFASEPQIDDVRAGRVLVFQNNGDAVAQAERVGNAVLGELARPFHDPTRLITDDITRPFRVIDGALGWLGDDDGNDARVERFWGGTSFADLGHHPERYAEELSEFTSDPFFATAALAMAVATADGPARIRGSFRAVDVSKRPTGANAQKT